MLQFDIYYPTLAFFYLRLKKLYLDFLSHFFPMMFHNDLNIFFQFCYLHLYIFFAHFWWIPMLFKINFSLNCLVQYGRSAKLLDISSITLISSNSAFFSLRPSSASRTQFLLFAMLSWRLRSLSVGLNKDSLIWTIFPYQLAQAWKGLDFSSASIIYLDECLSPSNSSVLQNCINMLSRGADLSSFCAIR